MILLYFRFQFVINCRPFQFPALIAQRSVRIFFCALHLVQPLYSRCLLTNSYENELKETFYLTKTITCHLGRECHMGCEIDWALLLLIKLKLELIDYHCCTWSQWTCLGQVNKQELAPYLKEYINDNDHFKTERISICQNDVAGIGQFDN